MKTRITMALSFLGLVAACTGGGHVETTGTPSTGGSGGGSTSTTSGTGGSGPTVNQACNDIAMARCARLQACSNGALITTRYGDMNTCVTRIELNCKSSLTAPDTGASPATTEACVADIPSESCTDYIDNNPSAACQAQKGTRPDGAACAFAGQCANSFCHVAKGAACGTCGSPPAAGAACDTAADCGYDMACTKAGTCATFVAANGMCDAGNPCEVGLACVGSTMTTMGTCQPQVTTMGTACDPTRKTGPDCERDIGLYCDPTSLTCKPLTFDTGGQPCGVGEACSGSSLCVMQTPPNGTCSSVAADGAACDDTNGPSCLNPARCVSGTCKLPDGASCM